MLEYKKCKHPHSSRMVDYFNQPLAWRLRIKYVNKAIVNLKDKWF